MNTRIEVIQKLIDENNYTSYLEIGYGSGECFNNIKCDGKICVDPYISAPGVIKLTSDSFFKNNKQLFDIIFIDGLHHSEQVCKDIVNASECLMYEGAIAMHDINPYSRETQEVPCKAAIWNGDCWRAWIGLKECYKELDTETHLFDHGIGVIFPIGIKFDGDFNNKELSYEDFDKYRDKWL